MFSFEGSWNSYKVTFKKYIKEMVIKYITLEFIICIKNTLYIYYIFRKRHLNKTKPIYIICKM